MNNSFFTLSSLYLNSNGEPQEGALTAFLASLPPTLIPSFKKQDIHSLFLQLYGASTQITFFDNSILTGLSKDLVIELLINQESYFCKLFQDPRRALREYLAHTYVNFLNIPSWTHVPILKMGKFTSPKEDERIYIISKKATGLSGVDLIRTLSKNTDNLASTELLFHTLGDILSYTHHQESYTFPEEISHHLLQPFVTTSPHAPQIQKISQDPLLYTFYKNFQTTVSRFLKSPQKGTLKFCDPTFSNLFLTSSGRFEVYDQGDLLSSFITQGKCYHFAEESIMYILGSLSSPWYSAGIPQKLLNHLMKTFLLAYYRGKLPDFRDFYETMSIWEQHLYLKTAFHALDASHQEILPIVKQAIAAYIKNPKSLLTKSFTYEN